MTSSGLPHDDTMAKNISDEFTPRNAGRILIHVKTNIVLFNVFHTTMYSAITCIQVEQSKLSRWIDIFSLLNVRRPDGLCYVIWVTIVSHAYCPGIPTLRHTLPPTFLYIFHSWSVMMMTYWTPFRTKIHSVMILSSWAPLKRHFLHDGCEYRRE